MNNTHRTGTLFHSKACVMLWTIDSELPRLRILTVRSGNSTRPPP